MDSIDILLDEDEISVLQYLKTRPNDLIAKMEIARRSDGKSRFLENPHWAEKALHHLADMGLIEDSAGKYRVKTAPTTVSHKLKKHMAPHLRDILEQSSRKLDLSGYA